VEASGSLTSYSWQTNQSSSTITLQGRAAQWSVGPFLDGRLSDTTRFHAGVGYTVSDPETARSLGGRITGPYAQVTLAHRVNENIDVWLYASRDLGFNSYSGEMEAYSANLSAEWRVLRKFKATTAFWYSHGNQVAYGAEVYDFFGPGVTLARPITRHLTAKLAYRCYMRESTLSQNQYVANAGSLALDYRF
jgi:hypothetical protein